MYTQYVNSVNMSPEQKRWKRNCKLFSYRK